MKKLISIAFILTLQFAVYAQTQFTITFNQGFGSLPTFTKYSDSELLTMKQAEDAFNYAKKDVGIEWRYSYAGCEKRAHAVSILLKGKGIKHYKIWNFNPMLISLFNKSEQPTVSSKAGLSPTVNWVYHVAILVFVKDGKEVKPMVIDPALDEILLTQQEWLTLQNTPHSFFTYLDPQWYNYASTDKFKYFCNNVAYPFPPCMDGILTGDFFLNDGVSLTEMWVEEALAINQLAMQLINDVIIKETNSDKKKALTNLVENFTNLTNALKGTSLTEEVKPYADILTPYQTEFNKIRADWKKRLDAIRK
jgi:hypothetical protein